MLLILSILVPVLFILILILILFLVYSLCRGKLGYIPITKSLSPAVVIDLSSKKSTVSTYLDESQSTMKEVLEESYSGSGAGNPLLVQRSIARQVSLESALVRNLNSPQKLGASLNAISSTGLGDCFERNPKTQETLFKNGQARSLKYARNRPSCSLIFRRVRF